LYHLSDSYENSNFENDLNRFCVQN